MTRYGTHGDTGTRVQGRMNGAPRFANMKAYRTRKGPWSTDDSGRVAWSISMAGLVLMVGLVGA